MTLLSGEIFHSCQSNLALHNFGLFHVLIVVIIVVTYELVEFEK